MTVKLCSKCKLLLPLSEFTRRKGSADGLNYHCKGCQRAYMTPYLKEYYKRNKPEYARRAREYYRKIRPETKSFIDAAKDVPCADCGGRFHPCAMDFDHVRGEKSFNISQSLSKRMSMEVVLQEMAKCDVVCANCHRVRTYNRIHQEKAAP